MARRGGITYQPALDGVRALAVMAVLLFHAGVRGFGGGYLGVSVFFTLSGYLITGLLVSEHDTRGRIDLASFYGRRLKRLLPASTVCLLAVVLLTATTDAFEGVADLRRQVLGAVFQVANWTALAGEGSYQDLLTEAGGSTSPLEHFWSLAIEEQFYWIWPPTMALLLARSTITSRVRVVGAVTVTAMVAAPIIARVLGPDAAYWATPARMGEILVGAFLAVVLHGRLVDRRLAAAAPAAMCLLGAAIVLFPSSRGPAYQGALPLVALCSGGLILGLQTAGPMRDALSWRPLVWLGKVSYGVYLFHWPIYVLLDEDRTSLDGISLLALRLAVTMAVATVSYYAWEVPVRHAQRVRPTQTFVWAAGATVAVAVAALAVPRGLGDYYVADEADVQAAAIDPVVGTLSPLVRVVATSTTTSTTLSAPTYSGTSTTAMSAVAEKAAIPTPSTVPHTTGPSVPVSVSVRPVRVLFIGDSTAKAFGVGAVTWAAGNPDLAQVEVVGAPGCGFVMGGSRIIDGQPQSMEGCENWVDELIVPKVRSLQPDVVAVLVTAWDVYDRVWEGDEILTPLDDAYAKRIEWAYTDLVDNLLDEGAGSVALIRQPLPDVFWDPAEVRNEDDAARHQVMFDIYDRIADTHPTVRVVALDRYFTVAGLDVDRAARPDGVHVAPSVSIEIAEQFLGDQLIGVALGLPVR